MIKKKGKIIFILSIFIIVIINLLIIYAVNSSNLRNVEENTSQEQTTITTTTEIIDNGYVSEIRVKTFGKAKSFVVGIVEESNHLKKGTKVNFPIKAELLTDELLEELIEGEDVHLVVEYCYTELEELLEMYPDNPVDLKEIKKIEIK